MRRTYSVDYDIEATDLSLPKTNSEAFGAMK